MSQFLDNVKDTVNTAVDTLSNVAQTFVEKNRTKAKLNRLRMVMKSESELMNRAYIALGKEYYTMLKKGEVESTEKQQKLVTVIDNSKAKIAKARDCYRKVLEAQNEFIYAAKEEESYEKSDVIDITVACSNEDDYSSSPFENAAPAVGEFAEDAEEAAAKTKKTMKDKAGEFKEKAEEFKENAAELAHEVKDDAVDIAIDAKEKAKDFAGGVREKAKDFAGNVKSRISERKEAADEADNDELF